MTKQKTKAELLRSIQTARQRLESSLTGLSEAEMTGSPVVGDWTVKDLMAHLVAWEQLFLSWYTSGLAGQMPGTQPVGMSKKAIDALNQQIYERERSRSLVEVRADFSRSYQQVWEAVRSISEEDMFAPGKYAWTGRWLLADYIAGNTYNHYIWASQKIREWRRRPK